MALSLSLSARFRPARLCLRCLRTTLRRSSTAGAPSPILARLREDMKAAMRAKDAARLTVIRSILADITNMSKTPSPVDTDSQLRALLLKKIQQSNGAAQEFRDAKREDLVEKEEGGLKVMRGYVGEIEETGGLVPAEEVKRAVKETVDGWGEGKPDMGGVMRKILGPGGALEGKMVDKADVAKVVKEVLGK